MKESEEEVIWAAMVRRTPMELARFYQEICRLSRKRGVNIQIFMDVGELPV